ncbi:MAG: tyrosine-type recombinase/integrase [Sulfitobacter sp.]
MRFHDLRHEGVTRLFEIGATISQVATVSGHRSWSSLQRYTHIKQTGDKYGGWKWLIKLGRPYGAINHARRSLNRLHNFRCKPCQTINHRSDRDTHKEPPKSLWKRYCNYVSPSFLSHA